jgi:hypothetical protein
LTENNQLAINQNDKKDFFEKIRQLKQNEPHKGFSIDQTQLLSLSIFCQAILHFFQFPEYRAQGIVTEILFLRPSAKKDCSG